MQNWLLIFTLHPLLDTIHYLFFTQLPKIKILPSVRSPYSSLFLQKIITYPFMLLKIFLVLLSLYIFIVLFFYFKQASFIFYPTKIEKERRFYHLPKHEEWWLAAPDGIQLHGLYFPTTSDHKKGLIIYFHGNAGSLEDWGIYADDLIIHGYDVLMPEYRGYGKSGGKVNEKAMHQDALAWYNEARKRSDPDHIILFGRSLGSGPATELATKVNIRSLILETPYWSIAAVASQSYPWLPIKQFIKYKFENGRKITKVRCPIYIFHGTKDLLINYNQAQRLLKAAGPNTELITIEEGGHNNLPLFEAYQHKLKKILE